MPLRDISISATEIRMSRCAHLAAPLAVRVLVRQDAKVVLGYHIIFTAYGFWLPNDPRGSWSDFVASWELCLHGRSTKTDKKRSLAAVPHDVNKRRAAKMALSRHPVRFTGPQAQSIGHGCRT